jgi:hypothetical protein
MCQLFSRAESSLHPHLSQDAAQILILEDLHPQAFEDHHSPAVVPHHQATDGPIETSIHTGPEPSLDPGHQDDIGRAQGRSRLDLALHHEDAVVDVIAKAVMEVEGGEARVIAATVVMIIGAGAEVEAVEVGVDVRPSWTLTF